jgi:hypothetical protein
MLGITFKSFSMRQEWNLLLRALVLALIIAAVGCDRAFAQSTGALHMGYEGYWKEDITWLTKISNESDGHKATVLLNDRKTEMLPKLEKLLIMTRDFKKSAPAAEQRKEEEWVMSNPLQEKDADMQASLMTRAASKGDEFARAVGDYMKAMMTTIKKAKQ